ncbi:hypothetical protein L209DRAFT_234502 [Thermothelomyces heterothallicus CBS 203.75]
MTWEWTFEVPKGHPRLIITLFTSCTFSFAVFCLVGGSLRPGITVYHCGIFGLCVFSCVCARAREGHRAQGGNC